MRGRHDVLLKMLPGVEFITRPVFHSLPVYDKYSAAFHSSLFFQHFSSVS